MPFILELVSQFLEVVDLSIKADDNRPILIRNRLIPGREINDAQTPVAETGSASGKVIAFPVRPPMPQRVCHILYERSLIFGKPIKVYGAGNAAHRTFLSAAL